jgi:tRNA threonylcarbamoyladenosine biosynthesis protein TsaE
VTFTTTVRTTSAAGTRQVGEILGREAQAGDVFLLDGQFGVGKTVLVQGLAAGLGIVEEITSPSFVLMVEHRGRLPLFHIDLYRLGSRLDDEMVDEIADAEEAGGVCAIEWPTALPSDLLRHATTIRIVALDDDRREITIEAPDDRLVAAVQAAVGAA